MGGARWARRRRASCCRCSTRGPSPSTRSAIDPAHPALPPGVAVLPTAASLESRPPGPCSSSPPTRRRIARSGPASRASPGPSPAGRSPGPPSWPTARRRRLGRRDRGAAVRARQGPLGRDRTAPGAGGTASATPTTIGSGARWCAGRPSSKLAAGNAFVRFGPIRPRVEEGAEARIQARIGEGVAGRRPRPADRRATSSRPTRERARRPRRGRHRPALAPSPASRAPSRGPLPPCRSAPTRSGSTCRSSPRHSTSTPARGSRSPRPDSTSSRARPPSASSWPPPATRSTAWPRATGGRVLADYEADQLAPLLRARTRTVTRTEETPLWDQPAALILFFAILTVEWIARKRIGLP